MVRINYVSRSIGLFAGVGQSQPSSVVGFITRSDTSMHNKAMEHV